MCIPGGEHGLIHSCPHSYRHAECVLYVLDQDTPVVHQHPDDIESIRFIRTTMPIDPHMRALREFSLLPRVHRFDRIAERTSLACFHLDERDRTVSLRNEIDIASPIPEAAIDDPPSASREPARRDLFAE